MWANVPGVAYPIKARWEAIPGVSFPVDARPLNKTKMENRQAKKRVRVQHDAEVRALILKMYDAGDTARDGAKAAGISVDTALKILRSEGRKVFKGKRRKLGRGAMKLREAVHAGKVARISDVEARVIAAYDAMPIGSRSGAKVASAVGIGMTRARRILIENGRELSPMGGKRRTPVVQHAKNAA